MFLLLTKRGVLHLRLQFLGGGKGTTHPLLLCLEKQDHLDLILIFQQVWEALLQEMPMTAMIRNLNKMTAIGLMADPNGLQTVCNNLRNEKKLHDARIHPFKLLLALRQYQEGHGDRGSLHWEPNPAVIGALDDAFYLAFKVITLSNIF